MYDTMLAVVFDDEPTAHKGATALKEMHSAGDVTVYASAVIAKDADGKIGIKQAQDKGPVGTAVGTLIGGLIGLVGGPAGVAVGMLGGMSVGAIRDIYVAGVDTTFLGDVAELLEPGKTAVVAEVLEGWQVPMDEKMKEAGGTVFRKPRVDVVDDQIARDAEARHEEWAEFKAEIKDANAERKAKLQGKLDRAKSAMEKSQSDAKARLDRVNEEAAAKIAALRAQIDKASDDTKAKYRKRIGEIEADLAERKSKLGTAIRLTGEALAA